MGIKKNTVVRGCLVPSLKNKPLDGRQDVPTLADIVNIENPYVNFIFPVAETGKWYKVVSLRTKVQGELEIPDGEIDKYELFGEGLTEEEKKEFLTMTLAEKTFLKKEDAEEFYLTKKEASEDYQPKGNYQPKGDYVTKKYLEDVLAGVPPEELPEITPTPSTGDKEFQISDEEPTDESVQLWLNPSESVGGEDTTDTEIVIVTIENDKGEDFTAPVLINGKEVLLDSRSSYSFKSLYGSKLTIIPLDIYMYHCDEKIQFTSSQPIRNVVIRYKKALMTVAVIDQTIADSTTAMTRTVDEGGIEAIRANSHRYVSEWGEGVMRLKQLDDNNGAMYADGTDASEDIKVKNVFMKMPKFYYMSKHNDANADKITIGFAINARPSEEWKEWDGNELIGVYLWVDGKSVSNVSYPNNNNGEAADIYGTLEWRHLCVINWLMLVYYKKTQLEFGKIGGGDGSSGQSNPWGMNDNVELSEDVSVNVSNTWGLEGFYFYYYIWSGLSKGQRLSIENARCTAEKIIITEKDGTERAFDYKSALTTSASGYIKRFYPGDNLDMFFDASDLNSSSGLYRGHTSITSAYRGETPMSFEGLSGSTLNTGFYDTDTSAKKRITYHGDWIEI